MSWKDLRTASAELAEFGKMRYAGGVAYLATIKADGSPRVHPVTPIIGPDDLFLFMEPTSPKGHDLRRDGRYALHSAVENSDGGGGEFLLTGSAHLVTSPEIRQVASSYASYTPADRYILFNLDIETAASTIYDDHGQAHRRRWKKPAQ